MPIQLVCWNMEKINDLNCAGKLEKMLASVKDKVDMDKPWVVAVLECKGKGENVATKLKSGLSGTASVASVVIDANGGPHTREKVVLVYGGGCALTEHGAHDAWKTDFNLKMESEKNRFLESQSNVRFPRTSKEASLNHTAGQAIDSAWSADNCRDPVVAGFHAGSEKLKVAFVHSPGPSAKATMHDKTPFAHTYFACISKALANAGTDVVMGDFNIYSSDDIEKNSDWDLKHVEDAMAKTGTTYKSCGAVSSSQLDRVFMHSKYVFGSKVKLMEASIDSSDHLGLYANIAMDTSSNGQLDSMDMSSSESVPAAAASAMQE
jgi:hypothetical protein